MSDNNILWRYAGLATQFFVGIAITVFVGYKADEWLKFEMPILTWVLPLLFIVMLIVKIVKDTSPKK